MDYLQLEFTIENDVEKEILIALLAHAGFESFEEGDKLLKAFIKENEFSEHALKEILEIVPVSFTTNVVPQQNWNAKWESSFEPIIINDFVAIRAAFHQPIKAVQHEIIITPKMSFGTGHHATTYLMTEQMQALDFTNKKVLDFGTGTAILAILAEKMGAVHVDAIDYDEWSIENSFENTAANNCRNINLIKADTISTGNVYDIILANINLNVILQHLNVIKTFSKKGTYILLSGFIKADENTMIQVLGKYDIHQVDVQQKADWICIIGQMN